MVGSAIQPNADGVPSGASREVCAKRIRAGLFFFSSRAFNLCFEFRSPLSCTKRSHASRARWLSATAMSGRMVTVAPKVQEEGLGAF